MGDNTKSTSKEEEMLEQTFGNYDSELTGEAGGSFDAKNVTEKKKGGKSSNKIIFIIVGVLAVLMIAYNFILPLLMPAPPKRPVNNNAARPNPEIPVANANNGVNNAANPAALPNAVPSTSGNALNNGVGPQGPVAPANPAATPAVPTDPNAAAMQAFLNQQQTQNGAVNPGASTPNTNVSLNLPVVGAPATPAVDTKTVTVSTTPGSTVTTVAPSTASTTPVVATVEVKPATTPTVPTTVVAVNTPSADNAASSNMLDSMKSYFDKQFSDVKSDISKFNKDIEKQVEATTALSNTVKDIDARLKKLEGGGGVAKVASSRPARAVSNSRVVRAKVQPTTTVVAKQDGSVIITERSEKNARPAADEQILIVSKADVRKAAPAVRENANGFITKYKIHSLYAGRVWIANSDNTHSNFSVGDRLPEGETIKGVDMDKGVISTDRGIIKVY